ncbi:Phospho-2-dehydro-3-deoxyheptonate aldolase, Trp-sensitive [Candidatus Providencia siddallii]|uniref:Phospho-2-dehydro-3-deoxyheptonate aldolase n=1 Tax=Candidatus Providencia siddallii TaxID=1715285 RepID=A0A0M6W6B6_9GAMM|nr:Phospho-2-dehydro-3-deoxyheptonate aldolase, Trp-sensitive [Candidatus Providencia siddallii]
MCKTDELRIVKLDSLISPQILFNELPITEKIAKNIIATRKRIAQIISGKDIRLLVIIGPCSIHDIDSAINYAYRLNLLRKKYKKHLEIIMRTYFEKPRTVIGWKGLIFDPNMDDSYQVNMGIRLARKFLIKVNDLGLPTATEFLDIITGQYISDLISWGAIGARTTESQIHREMASALSFPIGFKNGTSGDIDIAIDAIRSTRVPHMFLSLDKTGQITIYQTKGNPYCHIIIRGGKHPNYDAENIVEVCNKLRKFNLPEHLLVDFSHGNCQKTHIRQLEVAHNIANQIKKGSSVISGVMIESFLVEGSQKISLKKPLVYGQSITDPCLGWEDTKRLIKILNKAVKFRFLNFKNRTKSLLI